MKDASVRRLSSLHAALFRLTGGRLGSRLVDNDMLLLTTVGASTGQDHTVPLLYFEHEGALVVVASYGGRPDHPQWYKNLLADPRARAQIGNDSFLVESQVAAPEERSMLWTRVVDAYDGYEVYQSRTDRVIPLVLLRRR
ncbi:MAG: nitroreductase family deazaflavin-dependent oxidoreductase [Acidimicrobiia bacterium]